MPETHSLMQKPGSGSWVGSDYEGGQTSRYVLRLSSIFSAEVRLFEEGWRVRVGDHQEARAFKSAGAAMRWADGHIVSSFEAMRPAYREVLTRIRAEKPEGALSFTQPGGRVVSRKLLTTRTVKPG